jgi:hypothetical protein
MELMFNYVHNDLVPRLMVKRCHEDSCLFRDDGGNQNDGVVGDESATTDEIVLTTTTRDAFLRAAIRSFQALRDYNSKVDACLRFQVQKREKHYFVDDHQSPKQLHTALYSQDDILILRFEHIDGSK